ncbi:hypothetical protein [Pseudophaeobacter sp.]|uniref:hypothetical protein n=1 Tax=Pseudophaeobacter sp. TaxID=1971739 RepID=UPI00329845FC
MSTENVRSKNVIQIRDWVRSPITKLTKPPLQNVPSARELVQRHYLATLTQSDDEELFEAAFRDMDDNVFWQIIEIIEGAEYSVVHETSETATARSNYQAVNPVDDNS